MTRYLIFVIVGQILTLVFCIYCIFKYNVRYNTVIRHRRCRIRTNHRTLLQGNVTIPISIIPDNINEQVVINVSQPVIPKQVVSTPTAILVSNTEFTKTIPIAPHINPAIAISE